MEIKCDILTCAAILGSGFNSSNLRANLADVAWLFAFAKTPIALRSAICVCAGCNLQCVKYAASSRLLFTSLGSDSATRRRSSSRETPRRYSRVDVTSDRHYMIPVSGSMLTNVNARTSVASASDDTGTSNSDSRTLLNTARASESLFPETARYPSCSSGLIDCNVFTATGSTRLAEESSMFRRRCNWRGGNDALSEIYACDERYTEMNRSLRGMKLMTPC